MGRSKQSYDLLFFVRQRTNFWRLGVEIVIGRNNQIEENCEQNRMETPKILVASSVLTAEGGS